MTYKNLLEKLQKIDPKRLEDAVTIWDSGTDEYFPVGPLIQAGEEQDVLDAGHWVLIH